MNVCDLLNVNHFSANNETTVYASVSYNNAHVIGFIKNGSPVIVLDNTCHLIYCLTSIGPGWVGFVSFDWGTSNNERGYPLSSEDV